MKLHAGGNFTFTLNTETAGCSERSATTYKTAQKTKMTVGLVRLRTKVLRKIDLHGPTGGK